MPDNVIYRFPRLFYPICVVLFVFSFWCCWKAYEIIDAIEDIPAKVCEGCPPGTGPGPGTTIDIKPITGPGIPTTVGWSVNEVSKEPDGSEAGTAGEMPASLLNLELLFRAKYNGGTVGDPTSMTLKIKDSGGATHELIITEQSNGTNNILTWTLDGNSTWIPCSFDATASNVCEKSGLPPEFFGEVVEWKITVGGAEYTSIEAIHIEVL